MPSTSSSFFGSMTSAFRGRPATPVAVSEQEGAGADAHKPHMPRLPSTIELETHDFTREEIAEKRFQLLNDNGQLDWFLRSSGGPLEIQYLNMLGAHSSYWLSRDFVRFLVLELGRHPGRSHTLPAMRAVKKPFGK